jgi:hypothetical protein
MARYSFPTRQYCGGFNMKATIDRCVMGARRSALKNRCAGNLIAAHFVDLRAG